jgi:hypothetical protein
MKRTLVATTLLVTSLASAAWAGDFGSKSPPPPQGWVHVITKYCCDDYVRKCELAPPTSKQKEACCFVCDDYVRKCAPTPPVRKSKSVLGVVCDDYCRKCPPVLRCQKDEYMKCPPAAKHHVFKDGAR